jgi:hypothetical protein
MPPLTFAGGTDRDTWITRVGGMDNPVKRWAIATALAALAAPAPAQGDAVGIYDAVDATEVALAGPDVLVAQDTGGGVKVDAVPRAGGPPRMLLSVPSARLSYPGDALVASPTRVVVLVERLSRRYSATAWEIYSGPPSGPLQRVWRTRNRSARTWSPFLADVDGDRALVLATPWGLDGLRAWTFGAGAALARVPWTTERFAPVAIAGDYVGVAAAGPPRVVLADRATGAVVASHRVGPMERTYVDVAADGRLVTDTPDGLVALRPGTAPQPLPGTEAVNRPRFAGTAVAAIHEHIPFSDPVLLAPDGARLLLGGPTRVVTHHAADAQGVAWIANGCVRYAPIAGAPPPVPPAGDPCPATEISLPLIDSSPLRGRSVRVRVTCIATPTDACRGTLLIKRGLGHNGPVLSRGPFTVPAGLTQRVAVRLSRVGLRAARRDGTFQLGAEIPGGRVGVGGRGSSELTVKGA